MRKLAAILVFGLTVVLVVACLQDSNPNDKARAVYKQAMHDWSCDNLEACLEKCDAANAILRGIEPSERNSELQLALGWLKVECHRLRNDQKNARTALGELAELLKDLIVREPGLARQHKVELDNVYRDPLAYSPASKK